MNILFLSLGKYSTLNQPGIYTDLLRKLIELKNKVWVLSPFERRDKGMSEIICEENCTIVRVYTGNIQKTNVVEKGINTLLIENRFIKAIKKNMVDVKFDIILYPTPPITFCNVVETVMRRDNCVSYLMLKDIFPQNAVDIGLMSNTGLKSLLYKYFRNKEKKLYQISDYIGCMSQANVDYLLENNPELLASKVEICPNSIEINDKSIDEGMQTSIRNKYGIPIDKKVFIYGGNLGKPQDIPFIIKCLGACNDLDNAYFLIVGDGTDYNILKNYVETAKPFNVKLLQRLPREDYDTMVGACDVGLIFLDHRFTIPNFPSRLLSYMQAKVPVLACTDQNTDIGDVVEKAGFGWKCYSDSVDGFRACVKRAIGITDEQYLNMQNLEFDYLKENYDVAKVANRINECVNA